jgi:hypothetical protein
MAASLAAFAAAVALAACADRSALTLLRACVVEGAAILEHGTVPADVACRLDEEALVVAVPGRDVTAEEVLAAGLSSDAARLLTGMNQGEARLCVVEGCDPQAPANADATTPTPSVSCIGADVEIPQLVVARAAEFRLAFNRASSGTPMLERLEKLDGSFQPILDPGCAADTSGR